MAKADDEIITKDDLKNLFSDKFLENAWELSLKARIAKRPDVSEEDMELYQVFLSFEIDSKMKALNFENLRSYRLNLHSVTTEELENAIKSHQNQEKINEEIPAENP